MAQKSDTEERGGRGLGFSGLFYFALWAQRRLYLLGGGL